jgi:MFS family permease
MRYAFKGSAYFTKGSMDNMNIDKGSRRIFPPALYFPEYRNFWMGMFGAVCGFQVLMFGQFWLMHELTGSPLYLGYVGMANAIPAIVLNLIGGVAADRADKKRLIAVTQILSTSLVLLLGLLTVFGIVRVWHVMTIAATAGAINAFNQPARQALYPYLIERHALPSAVALNSAVWSSNRILAPAIAGLLIANFGTASAFFFAGAGMISFALVVQRLTVPEITDQKSSRPAQDMLDGLKFILQNSVFFFLIGMAFFNSFFGLAYVSLMPVFSREILQIGADGQGVLLSVNGTGALIMTLVIGLRANLCNKPSVIIGGAALFGLSIMAFALSSEFIGSYLLAGIFMFVMGICSSTYMISVVSSLQMMVPDYMRGRLMGIYGITWNIMPLGGLYAGFLAGFIGTPFAVALGGLFVTAFALGPAIFNKQVRNLGGHIAQSA